MEELTADFDSDDKENQEEPIHLLFTYRPDMAPLFDNGRPQLPADLIPIARLDISETIRPEARETIQAFQTAGVAVKLLSADEPTSVKKDSQCIRINQ